MIPLLIGAGFLLLAVPAMPLAKRSEPALQARSLTAILITGFVLLESALLLWATPALMDLIGATDLARICRRMLGGFIPGGTASGVIALIVALVLAAVTIVGVLNVRSVQRAVASRLVFSENAGSLGRDIAVLPVSRPIAFLSGGSQARVVISQGLIDTLSSEDLEAVLAHERSHARHRHDLYLLALGGIRAGFGWMPWISGGVERVRLSLERWADEDAAVSLSDDRQRVKSALVATVSQMVGVEVPAFGSAATIVDRVEALESAPPRSSVVERIAWLGLVSAVGLVAVVALSWSTSMSVLALTNPGLCIL